MHAPHQKTMNAPFNRSLWLRCVLWICALLLIVLGVALTRVIIPSVMRISPSSTNVFVVPTAQPTATATAINSVTPTPIGTFAAAKQTPTPTIPMRSSDVFAMPTAQPTAKQSYPYAISDPHEQMQGSQPLSLLGIFVGLLLAIWFFLRLHKRRQQSAVFQAGSGALRTRLGACLLWYLSPEVQIAILGDLEEEYQMQQTRFGRRRAVLWYYHQVGVSFWPSIIAKIQQIVDWAFRRIIS
jgi:hypothetical protein